MQNIIKESLNRNNGNGVGTINARGISHRGWTSEQRVTAAVDAVLGTTHVVPTIGQAARDFYVRPAAIRAELKLRAAQETAANEAVEHEAEKYEVGVDEIVVSEIPSEPPAYDDLSPMARCIVGVLNPAPYDDRIAAFRYLGAAMLWDALGVLEAEARSNE